MRCILAGSQSTPQLETWWDHSPEERGWVQLGWWVAVCRVVPPGYSSAWNQARVGWRTHRISFPTGFQRGQCFLVLPGDLVPCREMAQPHLLVLPSLPSFQCQPQPSQLTHLVLCTTKPCPCTLFPMTCAASPPPPRPATRARSHQKPREPIAPPGHTHRPTAVPCFAPASQNWHTKRNVSKHGPHLPPSRPKFHQAPKRGCWRAEAVSVNSVFTYEFQPKRRQRCRKPPTPRAFHPSHPSISPHCPGGRSSPCLRHSSPLLNHFSFSPDRRCLYLPACLPISLYSFLSAFTGKKCFYRRKCNQIKREMERSTSKLARQAFSVQYQGPNSAFIALKKNLDYLPLN